MSLMLFGILFMTMFLISFGCSFCCCFPCEIVDNTHAPFPINDRHQSLVIIGLWIFGTLSVLPNLLDMFDALICLSQMYSIFLWETQIRITYQFIQISFAFVQLLFLTRFSGSFFDDNVITRYKIVVILCGNVSSWITEEVLDSSAFLSSHTYQGETLMPTIGNFTNLTVECLNADTELANFLKSALPYLFPFNLEYNLLAAGVMMLLWNNMKPIQPPEDIENTTTSTSGRTKQTPILATLCGCDIVCPVSKRNETSGEQPQPGTSDDALPLDKGFDDQDSDAGASTFTSLGSTSSRLIPSPGGNTSKQILPVFLLAICLLFGLFYIIGSFTMYFPDIYENALVIFYSFNITFYIAMIGLCYWGFSAVSKHEIENERQSGANEYLLMLSVSGTIVYLYFSSISAVATIRGNHSLVANSTSGPAFVTLPAGSPIPNMMLAYNIINFAQIWLQTTFLIYTSHHLPKQDKNTAQVRAVILGLTACNFALWVVLSFIELKFDDASPVQENYFRGYWSTIMRLTYPLGIFYRFHSILLLLEHFAKFN
ncbi:uncharacterized protein LOC141915402 [Tubulanus polymorphus]|uniref:uncharacterized protein LOC141915402 n=1 Tax=Tubulanus polymorphus TaxID=672921 RepID=UPI003DA581E1